MYFVGFAQKPADTLARYELLIPYGPAKVQVIAGNDTFATVVANGMNSVRFLNSLAGSYKVRISAEGQNTFVKEGIEVKTGQNLELKFMIDGPCLYDHPAGYVPVCPRGHSDGIIPIVYGLSATNGNKFIKDRKDMTEKYAGCVTFGCDPKFYCKIHDLDL